MRCVDTDFLIAVLKGDKSAIPMIEKLDRSRIRFTTAVNAFELYIGAYYIGADAVKEVDDLLSKFHILPFDEACAKKAGEIFSDLKKKGLAIDIRDAMIASVALQHDLILVTRNVKHFERINGLKIEKW